MEETHSRFFSHSSSPTWATLLLAVAWCMGVGAAGASFERGEGLGGVGEWCGDRRGVGDKWFDGCQWCVCTIQGPECSSSTCSGLVRQVPVCHVPGERWTDGCYRCRCRRHGITCRLLDACRLLSLQPVPCLADERCVCGPDGVPSCTAAVIDRNAYAARRIHLGFPNTPEPKAASHRRHHSGGGGGPGSYHRLMHRRSLSSRQDYFPQAAGYDLWNSRSEVNAGVSGLLSSTRSPLGGPQTTQELLITSDNLCRFGARWYGGSLRCFCDLDGAIACGNPVFILALFDNFRVQSELCEEGHMWEDGCRVCTCQVSGVIFCQHSSNCPNQEPLLPQPQDADNADDDSDDFGGRDHNLEEFSDLLPERKENFDALVQFTASPHTIRQLTPPMEGSRCVPGSRWREGCLHCQCTLQGSPMCNPQDCRKNEVDLSLPTPVVKKVGNHQSISISPGNRARENPATLGPPDEKRFRGPMMVAPMPEGPFRPPAYASASSGPVEMFGSCGPFSVGVKYWDDCNLCLCTRRGPRCQGKLCR